MPFTTTTATARNPCENTGMFTGIITAVGHITAVHPLGDSVQYGKRLTVETPPDYLADVGLGDSIAINGACMTVTSLDLTKSHFTIDISVESLDKTTGLAESSPANPTPVNLEKALRAHDRLGGHIVSGHVDGIGQVSYFSQVGESWELRILAPADERVNLIEKVLSKDLALVLDIAQTDLELLKPPGPGEVVAWVADDARRRAEVAAQAAAHSERLA